jgi:hypothetical protein
MAQGMEFAGVRGIVERVAYGGFVGTAGGGMLKAPLVSVVENDQFCRESIRRLMRSLGYTVEAFSSAANFLASPVSSRPAA